MSLISRFLFFSCTIPFLLQGKILEVQNFKELVKHITKETLILLDIDDTLLVPVQMMGSDAWFNHRRRNYEKVGLSSSEALEKALAEWNSVRHVTEMEVVEPGTQEIVQKMQSNGYTVMGLTTQGLALATRTSRQLKDLGINLERTAPSKLGHYLNVHSHGALYREGILFTSGTPKGEALFALCKVIGYTPKEILFINDKLIHLVDVESEAIKNGVKYIGLRYAYSDTRKKAFNPEIADYQFKNSTFDHLLSDREGFIKLWQK
ncbi:MAG: DUF2608 domain-containing protein [Chlamydiales bacterium]